MSREVPDIPRGSQLIWNVLIHNFEFFCAYTIFFKHEAQQEHFDVDSYHIVHKSFNVRSTDAGISWVGEQHLFDISFFVTHL